MLAKRFLRSVVFATCGIAIFVAAACGVDVDAIRGPKIEELYLVIIRDPDAQLLALEKGQIDLLSDITRPVDIERSRLQRGAFPFSRSRLSRLLLGFNSEKPPGTELNCAGLYGRPSPGTNSSETYFPATLRLSPHFCRRLPPIAPKTSKRHPMIWEALAGLCRKRGGDTAMASSFLQVKICRSNP